MTKEGLTWEDIDEICHIYEVLNSCYDEHDEEFFQDILHEYNRRMKLKELRPQLSDKKRREIYSRAINKLKVRGLFTSCRKQR